jgi:spore coat polysaccharide biosynthesis predicted glycosyltransferase SpsG
MKGESPVLLVCDLGPDIGVGHLMRCLALAEEYQSRGTPVCLAADIASVPFAVRQVHARGIEALPRPATAAALTKLVKRVRPALVVIDSYLLPASAYSAIRSLGVRVVAVVDGEVRGREADVYLDPNLGGEQPPHDLPVDAVHLGGVDYALLRDEVLGGRRSNRAPASAKPRPEGPRVLLFFGGTDPFGGAPAALQAVLATGLPLNATVVAADAARVEQIWDMPTSSGQQVTAIAPTSRIVSLALLADAVLTAAGISTWELLHIGAPTGLVCVAENQRRGYEALTGTGRVVGLGHLDELRKRKRPPAGLVRLLTDADYRDRLRRQGAALVDGRGRRRVVDFLQYAPARGGHRA